MSQIFNIDSEWQPSPRGLWSYSSAIHKRNRQFKSRESVLIFKFSSIIPEQSKHIPGPGAYENIGVEDIS